MFRALPRPSSGAHNCVNGLWFYRWSVVVAALLVVVWPVITGQTTTNNETCWATHKHQVINLWNCCILLVSLFESVCCFVLCPRQVSEQLCVCVCSIVLMFQTGSDEQDEVTWQASWLPPLSCYYTDHSQLGQTLPFTKWCDRFYALCNETFSHNVFQASKNYLNI